MFKKILVANRGEIACRVMRTCKRLGIRTVAVHSQADEMAAHVRLADEAYDIGPAPARESYLCPDKILEVCRESGAEAIHPGYGFLSENSTFAQKTIDAGLKFIGPSPEVIHLMGDKLEAKRLARAAGVSLLPGGIESVSSLEDAHKLAKTLRFPLILKAVAGGGGKGMRLIRTPDDLEEGYARAVSEANSSFADGRVFLEEFIERPHHIEIQILADTHGNVVHLGERECSLQRRHQKVIEEAPSPFISEKLRQEIATQAVALAREVGYTSAGTVEFIVSPSQEFFFLEMNTRLQVEHPVTEMITNVDLVEEMIRIAWGDPLMLTQTRLKPKGHAIEARIYAEDADNGFLPAVGKIKCMIPPLGEGVRLDSGVESGDEISVFYDPMIAKLVTWGKTREIALETMDRALSQTVIDGPVTNVDFLQRLVRHPEFQDGDYSTQTIGDLPPYPTSDEEKYKNLDPDQQMVFAATAAALFHQSVVTTRLLSSGTKSWPTSALDQLAMGADWVVSIGKTSLHLTVMPSIVRHESRIMPTQLTWVPGQRVFSGQVNGNHVSGRIHISATDINLSLFGVTLTLRVLRPHIWELAQHLKVTTIISDVNLIKAPMPGTLIDLPFQMGDQVTRGQPVAIIEAMKMENILRAPQDGVVQEIFAKKGETLAKEQRILLLGAM